MSNRKSGRDRREHRNRNKLAVRSQCRVRYSANQRKRYLCLAEQFVFTPRDIAADSESVINPTVKFLRWPLPNAPEDALMEPHGTPPGEMVKNLIFTIS